MCKRRNFVKKLFVFFLVLVMVLSSFFTIGVGAENNYEILKNVGFEENDEFTWLKFITSPAIIEYYDEEYAEGEYSMIIYDRTHPTDTIRQYVTDELKFYGKGKYQLKAQIKLAEPFDKKVSGNAVIRLEDSSGVAKWFTDTYVEITADKWAQISFTVDIKWSGELKLAEFYFVTDEPVTLEEYSILLIDDCSFAPVEYSGEVFVPATPSPTPVVTPSPTPKPATKPNQTVETTPIEGEEIEENNGEDPSVTKSTSKQSIVIGVMLISIGVILLAGSVALFIAYRKEKQNEKTE